MSSIKKRVEKMESAVHDESSLQVAVIETDGAVSLLGACRNIKFDSYEAYKHWRNQRYNSESSRDTEILEIEKR